MTKKIMFRADAYSSIGIGDLMSFVNLSEYFERQGWECYFAVKDYEPALKILKDCNVKNYTAIDKNAGVEEEVEVINRCLRRHAIGALFIQVNGVGLSRYDMIEDNVFKACVYFGYDLPKGYDLVLSWDINSGDYFKGHKDTKTKFFIGPEYVILPAEFDKSVIEQRIYNSDRKKLLVTMGGADEFDFTLKVARRLDRIGCAMDITFVLGCAYGNTEGLKSALSSSNLKYKIVQNSAHMFREYLNCDIAIGSGGLTASELVASRTSALLIALHEHQIVRCEYFEKMGWAKNLGYRDAERINDVELKGFYPGRDNRFNIRIDEVVRHIDGVCS